MDIQNPIQKASPKRNFDFHLRPGAEQLDLERRNHSESASERPRPKLSPPRVLIPDDFKSDRRSESNNTSHNQIIQKNEGQESNQSDQGINSNDKRSVDDAPRRQDTILNTQQESADRDRHRSRDQQYDRRSSRIDGDNERSRREDNRYQSTHQDSRTSPLKNQAFLLSNLLQYLKGKKIDLICCFFETTFDQKKLVRFIEVRTRKSSSLLIELTKDFPVKIKSEDEANLANIHMLEIFQTSLQPTQQIIFDKTTTKDFNVPGLRIDELLDTSQTITESEILRKYRELKLQGDMNPKSLRLAYTGMKQLVRLNPCVRRLRYKFGLLSNVCLNCILQNNEVQSWFVENVDNSGNDTYVVDKRFLFVTSLKHLFDNEKTIDRDIKTLRTKFLGLMQNISQQQEETLWSQLQNISVLQDNLTRVNSTRRTYQDTLSQYSTHIDGLNDDLKLLQDDLSALQQAKRSGRNIDASDAFKTDNLEKRSRDTLAQLYSAKEKYSSLQDDFTLYNVEADDALFLSVQLSSQLQRRLRFLGNKLD